MKTIVHKVGNKINGEGIKLSTEELPLDEKTHELLEHYFLSAFKSDETYHFYSDSYLSNNIVYTCISEIFEKPTMLLEHSQSIARHLYDAAENPRVQGGELFIVYFNPVDENDIAKIGIFKTEKKETFLKIFSQDEDFDYDTEQGISLQKIDKAALIFNTEKENGFVIQAIDNNKNGDLYYWFEDFLKIKQRTDSFYHTQGMMYVYRDFITKEMPLEFEVTKADQADFLNKSLAYFKENEEFKFEDFTNEVLEDASVIESFTNYKTDYEQEFQVNIDEEFVIAPNAVKKSQRQFKSIIKLDKNFHIYIHGDRKKLEEGTDDNGKYYKLYFENEA